jgi:TRAP-type mannitol/chloroaromatic compound transport system substrate-binding protein
MLDEYTARNNSSLVELTTKHNVQLRKFPKDVLEKLQVISESAVKEIADGDPAIAKVYDSYKAFRDSVIQYHEISEKAYINAR